MPAERIRTRSAGKNVLRDDSGASHEMSGKAIGTKGGQRRQTGREGDHRLDLGSRLASAAQTGVSLLACSCECTTISASAPRKTKRETHPDGVQLFLTCARELVPRASSQGFGLVDFAFKVGREGVVELLLVGRGG